MATVPQDFDRTSSFVRRLSGAVSFAALIAAWPSVAAAQDTAQTGEAQTEAQPAEEPQNDDAIVVTGIRAGLSNSINIKRDETSIVEAISAEDIGKLPDVSIAESIARLPGLAAQRVNGRAQVISIRGLAPDFTTTLLNGRQQASSGDNRAVEFDQYPSELLSSVVIYKTPDASIAGMGLSGTADLRTVRPLNVGKRTVAMSLRGEYDEGGGRNDDFKKWGYRATVSYIDQFADDTLGLALGYARLDSPGHVDHYKAYGYEAFGGVSQPDAQNPNRWNSVTPDSADDALLLSGQEVWATNRKNVRDAVMGVVEWQPSDAIHLTLDTYYSRFKQREVTRGAQWFSNSWADNATFTDVTTVDVGGTLLGTSGTVTNVVPILRNDNNKRDDKLFSIGLNGEFNLSERMKFIGDFSYSRNKRDEAVIETYAGYGSGGPLLTRTLDTATFSWPAKGGYPDYGFDLNYADADNISLGDRAPWGGWGHDGHFKSPHVKETVLSGDMNLIYDFDTIIDAVEVGLNFTNRGKRKTVDELDLDLKNGRQQVLVGSQYLLDPTSLDFVGFGDVIAWDLPAALDDYYDLVPLEDANHYDKRWLIDEDVITIKVKANIDAGPLRGNVGLQVVNQWQASSGLRINPTISPLTLREVRESKSYTDILPSINLIYDLGGGHRLRLAAAKVLARPRMDEMRANFVPSFNGGLCSGSQSCQPGATVNPWSANGGNPNLEPWRAKAVDVAYEWYLGKASYISVAGYYKWLDNYIYNRVVAADFSEFPLPSQASSYDGMVISPIGQLTMPANGPGGTVKGIEISGALDFGRLTKMLDGFGVIGSFSYTKSNLNPADNGQEVRIPGLSGTVYNITGYFEKYGFQARASYRYRSAFKGEVVQLFTNRGFTEILADKQVDAQVGYTFEPGTSLEGLGILLQVNNLTNSPYRTRLGLDTGGTQTADGTKLPETYEKYGRQWLFGVNYKF